MTPTARTSSSSDPSSSLAFCSCLFNVNESTFCSMCAMSKSHRFAFSDQTYIAQQPLKLIHLDLWGPSPVISCKDCHYFSMIVDNMSWFTWILPLCCILDFYSVFQTFYFFVERLINFKFILFKVMMAPNSPITHSNIILQVMTFLITCFAPIHRSKMMWRRKNTNLLCRLVVVYSIREGFLMCIG